MTSSAPTKKTRPLMLLFGLLTGLFVIAALLLGFVLIIITPNLPELDVLTDYRPKIPLRVYTADGALIGEFGQERRDFVSAEQMPKMMKQALLAVEDSRFYEHGGVDFKGVLRAIVVDLTSDAKQGASTITMQVARDFFLTKEKLLMRKLTEVMLAYKIEAALPKEKILELYMNQVYLGQRAYGFGAAARIYFGKPIAELSPAQMAMLAGLPQRPADANPIKNFKRAKARQLVVLKRMLDTGALNQEQYELAKEEDLGLRASRPESQVRAQYVAEMVRQSIYEQYQEAAYTSGISVYTTLIKSEQDAAYEALRRQVLAYDQRHGYRGPEAQINLPAPGEERSKAIDEALEKRPKIDGMPLAVVLTASPKSVLVESEDGEEVEIAADGLRFVAGALTPRAKPNLKLQPGAVVRIMRNAKGRWGIVQLPQVQAGFAAIHANTGAYRALVGGFDFSLSKFNHVTQAWRQPGSTIKPFVYSAAIAKGFWPGTLISDQPLSISAEETGSKVWEPQNDDNQYSEVVTMRNALARSKNVVSVRILRAIGPDYARDFLPRFGFDADKHTPNLTMVLGTGSVTLQQMMGAYAVLANGGYKVSPYLIGKVLDARGKVLFAAAPVEQTEANRVLDARNAFLTHQLLSQVTLSGTAAAASQRLGRQDLAGKTGTTNDAVDGWFAGYAQQAVAVAWMGYDDPRTLGGREFGSTLAMPIWVDYMRTALAGKPQQERQVPAGLAHVEGDWMMEDMLDQGLVRTLEIAAPAQAANAASIPASAPPSTSTVPVTPYVPPVQAGAAAPPQPRGVERPPERMRAPEKVAEP